VYAWLEEALGHVQVPFSHSIAAADAQCRSYDDPTKAEQLRVRRPGPAASFCWTTSSAQSPTEHIVRPPPRHTRAPAARFGHPAIVPNVLDVGAACPAAGMGGRARKGTAGVAVV